MPNGLPSFHGRFPNDQPPTLLHPASPKLKPTKPTKSSKDVDAESMASTSSFRSTVDLIKSYWPTSYKDLVAKKEKDLSQKLPKDPKTPKQRTAEAYMYIAATK